MKEIVLVKFGEMVLKGLNKKTFEDMLRKNIKRRLRGLGRFELTTAQSTTYITPLDEECDLAEVVERVSKILVLRLFAEPAFARRISAILLKKPLNISAKFLKAHRLSR